jgi:hypothetical protein
MPAMSEISPKPFPEVPPGFVIRSVMWLRKRIQGLADSMVPADLVVLERSVGLTATQIIGAIARHRIPDLLEAGPLTSAEIAAQLGTDPDATHRMLRGAATTGFFTMDAYGRVRNNRLSRALRSDELSGARESAEYLASRSNGEAWLDFSRTLESGKNAFLRTHGASVWQWFDDHPDERETFARFMTGRTVVAAPVVAGLFPWREVKKVCDVGGGRGTLLSELLIRHPHLSGVLCDGAGVIDSARSLLQKRGVSDRVELVSGSFFVQVPSGADAYVLKNILHDWDDARSLQILGALKKAKAPRVLIVEMLITRNGTTSFGNLSDLQMMVVSDEGRERTREDYARLFDQSGFRLARVFESALVSVIEGVVK